jgi:hypothetical protein
MKQTNRSEVLERRFPYLCKVLYFPPEKGAVDPSPQAHPQAPLSPMGWYLRSPILPRVGDVIPFGQTLYAVTTVILDDCCSADTISRVDKQAGRVAEREDTAKWQAVLWVSFWGVASA